LGWEQKSGVKGVMCHSEYKWGWKYLIFNELRKGKRRHADLGQAKEREEGDRKSKLLSGHKG